MVLRVHQDKTYPGAMVASLSVPWGNTREEREGYHLVWPRDLVRDAPARCWRSARCARPATRCATSSPRRAPTATGTRTSGSAGSAYWQGVQLDETAFPVLLAAALEERDALRGIDGRATWCAARCRFSCATGR